MEKRLALSYYPLPPRYLERLEAEIGASVTPRVISAMMGRGSLHIALGIMRGRAETVYVPIPSRDWSAFTPLLVILALLMRPAEVRVVDEHLSMTAVSRWSLPVRLLTIALRTASAMLTALFLSFHLRALLGKPRQSAPVRLAEGQIFYIKSNLWAGITAGGSVSHTAGVIKALSDMAARTLYVSPSEAPELEGIRGVTPMRVPLSGGFIYPRELNSLVYNRVLEAWARRLGSRPISFVYHRLSLGSFAAVAIARRLKVPLVVEYNGSEVWINRNWSTRLKMERLAVMAEEVVLRHAHLVVTVSEALRQELLARGVEAERIVCHPNGYDQSRFDPARFDEDRISAIRRELGIPEGAVVATFVGTFGMWHGADILAQALIHLKENDPEGLERSRLHLLFVGDGVNRTGVEQRLAQAGLKGRYTFTGLVPPQQTPDFLAVSDLFVAPHIPNPDGSEFFGSPTKLFEYLGMGKPVLASDLAQIGEVMAGAPWLDELPRSDQPCAAGHCGILLPPAEPEALAQGLRFLALSPAWRRSAGDQALSRALSRYTWDHHVSAMLFAFDRQVPCRETGPKVVPPVLLINAVHSKSGGGLTYLRNVVPLLGRRHGFVIHLAVQADQRESAEAICREAGATLHVMSPVSRLATVLYQEQVTIPRLASRLGARVMFSPANYGPLVGPASVILLRNAFEVTTLEQRLGKRLYWLGVKLLTWACFATCRRAIIVSRHAARTFLDVFRMDSDPRIDVVHHGVGPDFRPPAPGAVREAGLLLAVSDIYVQKNFETLFVAMARLVPDFPDLKLRIAGRELDPGYAATLRLQARDLGIAERIDFLGSLPPTEVARQYRQAQVFVFPSLVETFGNPLVEAMASGVPVVCTESAAMPEITGGAALLARPRDADDLARQIRRLLTEPELWAACSARGLERAGDFSWERTAADTARILVEAAKD